MLFLLRVRTSTRGLLKSCQQDANNNNGHGIWCEENTSKKLKLLLGKGVSALANAA